MTRYLFLAGPADGETREVKDDSALATVTEMPKLSDTTRSDGAAVFHRYARREIRATMPDGRIFRRVLYVHESVPGPTEMQNELLGYLLGQWLMAGSEVSQGGESSQSA